MVRKLWARYALDTQTVPFISLHSQKFSLKSFVNKNKIQSYMNFFELDYLLQEIPEDRIKNKNEGYLIQVKNNEKKTYNI